MPIRLHAYLDMNSADGSEDSARRLADDLGRHRLTDVQEENEDDAGVNPVNTSRRTRYSSSIGSTASSMDYLWDLHPRRLSEAGLSRHSDNSTILTEDTDSFIIGQRVWVGGTKPGTIAYIGDTQFAPGEWAGIVLDQPIGKNDGSVGGTRYFQCESKKGVFSRLTRLTRYPLGNAEMGSGDHEAVSPLNNGARRSPISPSGSLSPFKSPPSLNASNTSLASTYVDFKIGDRVIIKSSQGSKIGVLRYIGGADFAAGEWCGVELDEPRGKNDGSVEGKRYFECRPNFGLFAPITKVSRSPSNRKPGNCVVHSGPGIPPSGFKRANSRESLASNTSITSAASGVRREVLKEKQQHIEQLLKERDLERAEIARASSQADENEQKYATLKQEYEQYKAEYEKKIMEHMDLLTRLKIDHEELLASVEDEKRKNEDLQFRYEEASITKSDIEQRLAALNVANETNIIEIKNLEERLAAEQRKIEALEGDSNKLFEAEEQMVRMREENEILKYEVEVATTKILSVESECMSARDSINSLKREVNELQIVLRERDETIEKIQSDDKKISVELSDAKVNYNQELDAYKKQLEGTSDECLQQKKLVEALQSDLSQTKQMLNEKTKSFETLSRNLKEFEEKMGKELEKLKMEVSAKNLDLETSGDIIKAKDEEIKAIKSQLETLRAHQEAQSTDVDKYNKNMKATENALRKELDECNAALRIKIAEVEEVKKEFNVTLSNKTTELNEANKTVQTYLSTIKELKTDLSKIKEAFAESTRELEANYERQLKEADGKIGLLASELHQMNEGFSKSSDLIAKLEIELGSKNDRLLRSETELNAARRQLETETTSSVALNNTVNNLQLRIGDLERLLKTSDDKIAELAEQKIKLLGEVQSLINSSGDYSTKLDELTKELRGKDGAIQSLKEEFTSKLRDAERSKQELELNHNAVVLKNERERLEHEEKIKQITASDESLKLRYETHLIESVKATEDLNAKLRELQNEVSEKDQMLQKLQKESQINVDNMKDTFDKTCNQLRSTISNLEGNISALTIKNSEAADDLSKKSMELIEAERKHNAFLELSKLNETKLKAEFDERFRKLEVELSERESEKLKMAEKSKMELCEKLDQAEMNRSELQASLETILLGIERDKTERDEILKNMVLEKDASIQSFEQIIVANEQSINDLNVKVKELESSLLEKDVLLKNIDEGAREKEMKLKEEFGKASGDLQSNLCEFQKKIDRLEKENNEMKLFIVEKTTEFIGKDTEFNALVEKTKQREIEIKEIFDELAKNHSSAMLDKDIQIQQLSMDLQEVKVGASKTSVASGEMNDQIAQLKSELKINHQFVDKLQNENIDLLRRLKENDEARELNAKQCAEMEEKLSQLTDKLQQINDKSCNLKSLNEYYETILKLLKLTHKQKNELLQTSSKNCTYWDAEGSNKLVELVENIEVGNDREMEENISQLQDEVVKHRQLHQEAENTIKLQTAEIIRLGDELKKNSEVNRTTNGTSKIAVPVGSKVAIQSSNKQLMEEKLFAENQVAFLNCIIVDMQKKNEEQKVRIEILESGYSPNAVDELKLFGFADRKLPPRKYCDICEEFDLHETEDCPQQANEDLPTREKSPKDKPPQRPYCDICEAFGHMTEDCQEDQTF